MSAGLVLWGAGLVGCAPDATNEGPATGQAVLFKDPSTSGPRLDIYDVDGHAAISVSGPIGTEGNVSGLTGGDSLEKIYRAIHPTISTVPQELLALDKKLAPELAALRATPGDPTEVDLAPTLDKSESAFRAAVCKNFVEGSRRYKPAECAYWRNPNPMLWVGRTPAKILSGDRTYGWNNTSHQADLMWATETTLVYAWRLPAYWWTWTSFSGGGPYQAAFGPLDAPTATGDYGLTWHKNTLYVP